MFIKSPIALPDFRLSEDFPWRVGFVIAVDEHLRRLRTTGRYMPARFFGYYFRGDIPVGVSGDWTVALDRRPPVLQLPQVLDAATGGYFSIVSESRDRVPDYLLLQDRQDCSCWLWEFADGRRFVEATKPFEDLSNYNVDDVRNSGLMEP